MDFLKCFKSVLTTSKMMIEDYTFKSSNRTSPSHFTRSGKMGFKETMLFMLNMVNKSLQTELNSFFEKILKKDYSISKQAFSENRQKISPDAFVELNDAIIKVIYQECDESGLWNGYRLSAIDGSILELPNTEVLRNEFGCSKNQRSEVARAKASCIYDVINKIVIKSKIDRCGASEKNMANELISEMLKNSHFKELILFDRGYPSKKFISELIENDVNFVMRTPINKFAKTISSDKQDQIIEIKYGKKTYKIRVLVVPLESGVKEILLTNLFEEKYKINDFKELYFKRWGIESKYDELKNRLEIENFTGTTKIAVEQDFYASIYLSNMISLARHQSDEIVKEEKDGKALKYEYKTNFNTLIGSLKDKLIMIYLEDSARKRSKMFDEIMKQVSKSCIPIRPKRQNPRTERLSRAKYRKNHKRSL